jgi:hypothetical protein
MNSYELSRDFWDFAFENPEKIKPNHCAIYFFAVEHCNRLGWKEKFGFPTTMVMDAVGIKSYNTFLNGLNDLVEFGFIKMIERSKNQYSANIIALSKFDKALDNTLDKAFINHATKQSESTVQSIDSIDKPINNKTNKQIYRSFAHLSLSITDYEKLEAEYDKKTIDMVLDSIENYKKNNTYKSLYLTAKKWLSKELKKKSIIESDEWEQDFKLGDVMPNGATLTADVINHHQQTGLSYKRLAGL